MRASVEVYEDNAGGIYAAVFGRNGLTNLFVVTPDGNKTRMTRAFYQEALYGFPGENEYNAEDFSGLPMDDAYADICNSNLIAEFYDNRVAVSSCPFPPAHFKNGFAFTLSVSINTPLYQ